MSKNDLANAIRALSMDAVQQANSGHPGMPMGMADIAAALWHTHFRHNPASPQWPNRDRFILSNGHGSMLHYALLHLTGYALAIDDLKQFRQLHSKTPGHPEYGYTPGIETTTGPLGQGLANAVGMALAEKLLAAEFNRPGFNLIDHRTYVFVGDGCLMEGISHEACSLAGTLGLEKLVVFYDDNGISIDGHVEGWFTDDTPGRFEAYGWNVIRQIDGHDIDEIGSVIGTLRHAGKPTLICCQTTIGKGAPRKQGTHDVHGAPLGAEEVAATRAAIGWPHAPFDIPEKIYAEWSARKKGARLQAEWNELFADYQIAHGALAKEFQRRMAGDLPADFQRHAARELAEANARAETIATRKASQNAIRAFAPRLPEMIGGSADLAGSNLTLWPEAAGISREEGGNYIYYGVREFGMAAIMNGLTLYGGFRPFGGTFLMFSEYARNALRMAALMRINPIFVFTHDSIGVGEDGPTHQPVEQTATLRMIPNMDVWRPADTAESLVAWQVALEHRRTPSCLIFCRQNLPYQPKTAQQLADIRTGGYILKAEGGALAAVLIATGSEVELAVKSQEALASHDIFVRVVSMPSTYNFDRQDAAYKNAVLPEGIPRVAIEAGVRDYWRKYVGLHGGVVGMDTFGESGTAASLYEHFGLTVPCVCDAVHAAISK